MAEILTRTLYHGSGFVKGIFWPRAGVRWSTMGTRGFADGLSDSG